MDSQQFYSSLIHAQHTSEPGRASLWDKVRQAAALRFRAPEQGGYVHDTACSLFIPPSAAMLTVGAWTATVSPSTALVYNLTRTIGAATNQMIVPICPPQNAASFKGSLLKSIDLWWEMRTVTPTTITPLISRVALPADTVTIPAPTAPAFTYDSLNDTNAKRIAVGKRMMTLTITTPFWIASSEMVYLDFTLVATATAAFDWYGARANFTLRL